MGTRYNKDTTLAAMRNKALLEAEKALARGASFQDVYRVVESLYTSIRVWQMKKEEGSRSQLIHL